MKVTTVTFEGTPDEYREYLAATAAVAKDSMAVGDMAGRSEASSEPPSIDLQEFMHRALNRMPLPDMQVALFNALHDADGQQLTKSEIEARIGRTPQELSGVLGALGRRIRGTPGFAQVTQRMGVTAPIEVFLEVRQVNGRLCYALRPELRRLLERDNTVKGRE